VQNFGVLGYVLPVIVGLAIVGAAAAFLIIRLNRPGRTKWSWPGLANWRNR
jgi:hypothetical protein